MAKRDDLQKEAKAGKGLLTALVVGAMMEGAKAVMNYSRKEQIEQLEKEIEKVDRDIEQEKRVFILFRDEAKIESLCKKKAKLILERNKLLKE